MEYNYIEILINAFGNFSRNMNASVEKARKEYEKISEHIQLTHSNSA